MVTVLKLKRSPPRRHRLCWNLPGPPGDGLEHVFVVFAPTRTAIQKVWLLDAPAEPIAGWRTTVWRVASIRGLTSQLLIDVDVHGEPPSVAGVVLVNSAEPVADVIGVRDAEAIADDQLASLLERRAAEPFDDHQRFFLRFDAWTTPTVLTALRSPQFVTKLSINARELFVDPGIPGKFGFASPDAIASVASALALSVIERGQRLLFCERALPELPGLPDEEALPKLARYLTRIFDHCPAGPGSTSAVSRGLDDAFARFASGALAIIPRGQVSSAQTLLNAEPDSSYFFSLAEFALRATEEWEKGSDYWHSLACLFVALEDPFMTTYGPCAGPRNLEEHYLRHQRWLDQDHLIPLQSIRDAIGFFRERFQGPKAHDALTLVHEMNILHAHRDELVKQWRDSQPPE